jgi:hypothetical protein
VLVQLWSEQVDRMRHMTTTVASVVAVATLGLATCVGLAGCGCSQPPARAQSSSAQAGVAYPDACKRSPGGLPDFDGTFWSPDAATKYPLPLAYRACVAGSPQVALGTFTLLGSSSLVFRSADAPDVRFERLGAEVPNPCA